MFPLLGAMLFGGAGQMPSTERATTAEARSLVPGCQGLDDPLAPLSEQLAGGPPAEGAPIVSFAIAMLPDPYDSHLANGFDRALESLQRAMEDRG